MGDKNQKGRPIFAEMNISGRPTETERQAAGARTRYECTKLTYPNGVTLTLPQGTAVSQPIERIVVVRKDDEMRRPIQHPCYEGPIWKSKASAELLSYIETCKYAYHMPFHRLLRKMKRDGLVVSDTTVDGWHKMVCQMLEPLYELQKRSVMRGRYLAADGSPMPVLNSEK